MSNVVSLRRAEPIGFIRAQNDLVDLFANRRRKRRDAFWLKENAELLQILAATQGYCPQHQAEGGFVPDLSAYADFVHNMVDELRFFPQYYRFYLSMALDLSALGLPGVPVVEVARIILDQRLAVGELSDSHRGEARLLLSRAGFAGAMTEGDEDAALTARLTAFAEEPALFCLPNRQLAYALTHTVFHASDYGRKSLTRSAGRRLALMHAGIIAWLEDNLDLLAEVSIALDQSAETVPAIWRDVIAEAASRMTGDTGPVAGPFDDDYHEYLVVNWAVAANGAAPFATQMPQEARFFHRPKAATSALREMSLSLLDMGPGRTGDWARMRWRLWPKLSATARAQIEAIETLPEFEGFFHGFARAGQGQS